MTQQRTMNDLCIQQGQAPVCGHASLQSVLVHGKHGAITVRQWLRDVRRLLACLPKQSGHIVNICEDRYHFLLGLGRACCEAKSAFNLLHSHLPPGINCSSTRRMLFACTMAPCPICRQAAAYPVYMWPKACSAHQPGRMWMQMRTFRPSPPRRWWRACSHPALPARPWAMPKPGASCAAMCVPKPSCWACLNR